MQGASPLPVTGHVDLVQPLVDGYQGRLQLLLLILGVGVVVGQRMVLVIMALMVVVVLLVRLLVNPGIMMHPGDSGGAAGFLIEFQVLGSVTNQFHFTLLEQEEEHSLAQLIEENVVVTEQKSQLLLFLRFKLN